MITYASLSKRPKHFHRLTGITLGEFDIILDKFKSGWEQYVRIHHINKERQRAYGGGNKPKLGTLEDKLLFILVYVRMYPLLFLHGLLFDLAESNTCTWVHRLLLILDEALGYAHRKPARHQGRSFEELITEFPELIELGLLGDGTERPVRRPKNKEQQKQVYSGKKKRHTKKNILLVKPTTTEVVYLGKTQDGKMHDKKALDEEKERIKPKCRSPVPLGLDLGFQGSDMPGFRLILPTKKPKGGQLTDDQKQQNKAFSGIRIRVEHAIAGIKRNRSVADIHRNMKEGTDDLFMSIACGLHNLRVAHRYTTK